MREQYKPHSQLDAEQSQLALQENQDLSSVKQYQSELNQSEPKHFQANQSVQDSTQKRRELLLAVYKGPQVNRLEAKKKMMRPLFGRGARNFSVDKSQLPLLNKTRDTLEVSPNKSELHMIPEHRITHNRVQTAHLQQRGRRVESNYYAVEGPMRTTHLSSQQQ